MYEPGIVPDDPKQLQAFLKEEFRKIQQAGIGSQKMVWLDPQYVALAKPRDGMSAYADGTNWAPITGAGKGVYAYVTNGWQKLLTSAGLFVKDGADQRMGAATLVAGTATVNNTAVTANSRIFLTAQNTGGTPGALRISARVAGTSFTITSTSAADTSTVAWLIAEPV